MRDKVIVITGASSGIGEALAKVCAERGASKAAVNSIMTSLRLELALDFPEIVASTFMPGVVATDFGKNALHGGPDSRALPMSQPVEDVATRLAALIEAPRAEAYSRPELQQLATRYFAADDVAPIEAQFVARPR